MLRVPFRFLEGCLIAAHGIQSQHVFVYIRGEYEREFEVLRDSLEAMRKADLLGGVTVVIHRGAGAYICGEETALLESLEGKRGQPRTKPPFPAIAGLYAAPTAVNNVESITTVTPVLEMGGAEYAKLGVENSSGTRVFSLSGNVANPGNYELPHGISMRELIYDIGGGVPNGRELKAIIPGGSSTSVLTAADIDTKMDFTSLVEAGLVDRLGRRDRHRRPLLHGAARHPRLAVLRARVVREVHAVPRRDEVGDADPPEDRGRARRRRPTSTCSSRSATGSWASACARSATRTRSPFSATSTSSATSTRRTSTSVAARSTASPRSRGSSRPPSSTPTTATSPPMSELVSVTVDDRNVSVPKGTGLVEAAQAAGIEIPVFCYEPRLGAPVGACRMCLVEIEGMPKLQAACTLTVAPDMVIRTGATSEKAAEGQEATLEFILVNHPLDCPVCDKGGECPLQDLTFRHGPGNTRMTFQKHTVDKPIPVSPLIALDRERCILCYRCTRFSEDVAEDGQLIARNRGALTEIATFEDEPYRSPFSGNVIELCPVGALTSTLYRFDARPWDIQNVPTVCTGCAVGCNTSATIREGKVRRILSRNHPEIDRGWLCDKGRFTYPHLRAEDRITTPLRRGPQGPRGDLVGRGARRGRVDAARGRAARSSRRSPGSETTEIAYALGRLLRGGLGAHSAVLPEATSDALDAFRLPLSGDRARPSSSSWSATTPSSSARRSSTSGSRRRGGDGAEVVVCSPAGTEQTAPGSAAPSSAASSPSGRSALGEEARAPPSAPSSSGRAPAEAAARASQSSRTRSASRTSPAAARSTSPPPPTRAASRSPGRSRPTRTRRTRSRSSSSSSPATRPPSNPRRPRARRAGRAACSCSRCSTSSPPAGPT